MSADFCRSHAVEWTQRLDEGERLLRLEVLRSHDGGLADVAPGSPELASWSAMVRSLTAHIGFVDLDRSDELLKALLQASIGSLAA